MLMKVRINMQSNFLLLLKIFLFSLLLQQGTAWGAKECRFGSGYGGTTTLTNSTYSGGTVRIPQPNAGFYVSITRFEVSLSPTLTASCSAGNDGEDLWSKTDTSVYAGTVYQEAAFQTNIPGVVYTVYIVTKSSGGGGSGGYFAGNTADYKIIAYNDGAEDNWDGKQFTAYVEVGINSDFHGNPNKETVIHPKAGTLGYMSLGDHNDSNNQPWKFMVNEASFQIPVILPTCDIAVLSSGGNTVDMGDYYISDIKNNKSRDVPFAIKVSDCTSVAKFTTKMTSATVTGSENLLGNTLGSSAASGMGVKILYEDNQQLVPNNSNSTYIYNDTSVPDSTNINLIARLVADGKTLKAGQFTATSIFVMSYD